MEQENAEMCRTGGSPGPGFSRTCALYSISILLLAHLSHLCFSCIYQDMVGGGGGVIATEKYGSQEAWTYRIQDGGMRRERAGDERVTRGKSITAAFKVHHLCLSSHYTLHGVVSEYFCTLEGSNTSLCSSLERFPAPGLPRECQ